MESREQVKQNEGHGKHKKMVVDAVPLMLGLKHNEIIEESLQSLYDGV